MAKVAGQWASGLNVAAAPRMSAHLSNVSIGPEDGARVNTTNDGTYSYNDIKNANDSGSYGFIVVDLHSEVASDADDQLKSSTWIFQGAAVSTSSAHGTMGGTWTCQWHHRTTHEENQLMYSLHGARQGSYWAMRGPIHNSSNDPGWFYNTTDGQIACWWSVFDQWRSNSEPGSSYQWAGNVTVIGTNNYPAGGAGTSKNFFTNIYTSPNLPGTNNNWTHQSTVNVQGRTTHGQGF